VRPKVKEGRRFARTSAQRSSAARVSHMRLPHIHFAVDDDIRAQAINRATPVKVCPTIKHCRTVPHIILSAEEMPAPCCQPLMLRQPPRAFAADAAAARSSEVITSRRQEYAVTFAPLARRLQSSQVSSSITLRRRHRCRSWHQTASVAISFAAIMLLLSIIHTAQRPHVQRLAATRQSGVHIMRFFRHINPPRIAEKEAICHSIRKQRPEHTEESTLFHERPAMRR